MNTSSFDTFEAEARQAEIQLAKGQYPAAFQAFHDALVSRTAARGSNAVSPVAGDLQVIERLASLAALYGAQDAADDLLQSYCGFAQNARNGYAADYAAVARVHLALSAGQLRTAQAVLLSLGAPMAKLDFVECSTEGLTRWESSIDWNDRSPVARAVLLTQIYLAKGQLLTSNGQYAGANLLFMRGFQIAVETANELTRHTGVHLRLCHAASLAEMGSIAEALEILSATEAAIDPVLDPGSHVRWLESIAKCEMLTGKFGGALARFDVIRRICTNGHFDNAGAIATLNRAHIQILLNRTSEATAALRAVEAFAQSRDDSGLATRAEILLRVANARSSATETGSGIVPSVSAMWGIASNSAATRTERMERDLGSMPQPSNFLAFFEDRALLFQWDLGIHDVSGAQRTFEYIEDLFSATDSKLIAVRRVVLSGMLQYYQEDYQPAMDTLTNACLRLEKMNLKPELWQATRMLGWCSARLGYPHEHRQNLVSKADVLLRELTDSLSRADQAVFLLNKWTAQEEHIAGRLDAFVTQKGSLDRAPWYRRLFMRIAFMRKLDNFLGELAIHKEKVAYTQLGGEKEVEATSTSLVSFIRRLISHSPTRATISFVVLPDRIAVLHRGFLTLRFGVSEVSRIRLRECIRTWHQDVQRFITGPDVDETLHEGEKCSALMRDLDLLAQQLQIPQLLRDLPRRVRALRIEPDDGLHGLPFAALQCDERYLFERFALSIAPTAIQSLGQRKPKIVNDVLLAAVSRGDSNFSPLPGSRYELERIRVQLRSQGLRVDHFKEEATKSNILQSLGTVRLLHIACHGVFRADRPGESGLMLAAPNKGLELLSLKEILDLELSNVQHVTLSSCWSADNFVWPGRWIVSLPQTLCLAGVGSVLGCLWPVNDEAAVEFMASFYENLRFHSLEEALRRTQLAWVRGVPVIGKHPEWREPIFWAGFNLYGDGSGTLQ